MRHGTGNQTRATKQDDKQTETNKQQRKYEKNTKHTQRTPSNYALTIKQILSNYQANTKRI